MLRALEMGTAGLKAPTGEAVEFPTNTSDALMSGGADAIAGAVDRMHRKLETHRRKPELMMSGGAAVKLASITDLPCRDGRDADLRRPAAPAVEAPRALTPEPAGREATGEWRPTHRRNALDPRRRQPRGLRRQPLQPAPPAALRRRPRGAGLVVAVGRAAAVSPMRARVDPGRGVRRRRCRAATCCGSCRSPRRAASASIATSTPPTGVMQKNEPGALAMTRRDAAPAGRVLGRAAAEPRPKSSSCTTRRTRPATSPTRSKTEVRCEPVSRRRAR